MRTPKPRVATMAASLLPLALLLAITTSAQDQQKDSRVTEFPEEGLPLLIKEAHLDWDSRGVLRTILVRLEQVAASAKP